MNILAALTLTLYSGTLVLLRCFWPKCEAARLPHIRAE